MSSTHLLGQSVDEVAGKIAIYRQPGGCRLRPGHRQGDAHAAHVRRRRRRRRARAGSPAMKEYLRSSIKLMLDFAWSFAAFKRPGGGAEKPEDVDLRSCRRARSMPFSISRLSATSRPAAFRHAIDLRGDGAALQARGVDEIACLLDFGVPTERVLRACRTE